MKTDKAILYVANHFRENLDLQKIAESCNLSKFHFHRLFVKEYGCTPQAYLERVRLEHAAHFMILFPTISITEVAFECGYSSPACFSRSFKNFHGMSATRYRSSKTILRKSSSPSTIQISVQYLTTKHLKVRKVKLDEKELTNAYKKLAMENEKATYAIGFFLDVPVHIPAEKCRYYAGVESIHPETDQSLTMQAGYYTSVTVNGTFDDLKETLFRFREQIETSGYVIDSLVGYEKIMLTKEPSSFSYFESPRELFIKIKRG